MHKNKTKTKTESVTKNQKPQNVFRLSSSLFSLLSSLTKRRFGLGGGETFAQKQNENENRKCNQETKNLKTSFVFPLLSSLFSLLPHKKTIWFGGGGETFAQKQNENENRKCNQKPKTSKRLSSFLFSLLSSLIPHKKTIWFGGGGETFAQKQNENENRKCNQKPKTSKRLSSFLFSSSHLTSHPLSHKRRFGLGGGKLLHKNKTKTKTESVTKNQKPQNVFRLSSFLLHLTSHPLSHKRRL